MPQFTFCAKGRVPGTCHVHFQDLVGARDVCRGLLVQQAPGGLGLALDRERRFCHSEAEECLCGPGNEPGTCPFS